MEGCEENRFRGETGCLALMGGVRGAPEHWVLTWLPWEPPCRLLQGPHPTWVVCRPDTWGPSLGPSSVCGLGKW